MAYTANNCAYKMATTTIP